MGPHQTPKKETSAKSNGNLQIDKIFPKPIFDKGLISKIHETYNSRAKNPKFLMEGKKSKSFNKSKDYTVDERDSKVFLLEQQKPVPSWPYFLHLHSFV